MPKRKQIKANELVKILERAGFVRRRSRGSHLILKHSDGRRTIVPMHSSKNIPIGTLKAILKDVRLDL